jgi:2,4-dienoyl-CoA reductase (NADPH2)
MGKYQHLFSELKLKHTSLKNRFVMGSMHTGLEEASNGYHKMAAFYKERAKGGVGLIITGGIAPNFRGRAHPFAKQLTSSRQIKKHKIITDAVHQYDCKICLQILHVGRYAYHPFGVSASALKAPISPFKPQAMNKRQINKTIQHFARCARLSKEAGYDGVEIMGSEGYLINQFLANKTNKRNDEYGGSFENRKRLAIEIVKAVRAAVGPKFILIFRLSLLDLVEQGQSWDEVVELAHDLEELGIDIIDSGIGWHEARVPTIATMVPRAAFRFATAKLKKEIKIPIMATNRINTPEVGEEILASGDGDLISMARPFLADAHFVNKAQAQKEDQINTCIACNQACLDHIFENKITSCLVNPKACHEMEFLNTPREFKKMAVVGAGPSGVSFAIEAASLGHEVTLYERKNEIAGQFNLAKNIPGKEEFKETIRYFHTMLKEKKVDLRLETEASINDLKAYDEIIVASGVAPRIPKIEGIDHSKVVTYQDILTGKVVAGSKVAIIGAGGIGFDIAEFLAHNPDHQPESLDVEQFFKHWGIDSTVQNPGAISPKQEVKSFRELYLFQRKQGAHGKSLGKTTGWIHRASLKDLGIHFMGGVSYQKIDDNGLHFTMNDKEEILDVDHIVLCAGQIPVTDFYDQCVGEFGQSKVHLIGGALEVSEIDAKKAINEGVRLAYRL